MNHTAEQHLCFSYMYIVQSLYFCGCTAQFMLDLVGNPEDSFSCHKAHMVSVVLTSFDLSQPFLLHRIPRDLKYFKYLII